MKKQKRIKKSKPVSIAERVRMHQANCSHNKGFKTNNGKVGPVCVLCNLPMSEVRKVKKTKFSVFLFQHNLQLSQVQRESKLSYKLLHDMKAGIRDNFNDASWQSVVDAIIRLQPSAAPVSINDIKGF